MMILSNKSNFLKVVFILWLCGRNVLVLGKYMLKDLGVKYIAYNFLSKSCPPPKKKKKERRNSK